MVPPTPIILFKFNWFSRKWVKHLLIISNFFIISLFSLRWGSLEAYYLLIKTTSTFLSSNPEIQMETTMPTCHFCENELSKFEPLVISGHPDPPNPLVIVCSDSGVSKSYLLFVCLMDGTWPRDDSGMTIWGIEGTNQKLIGSGHHFDL